MQTIMLTLMLGTMPIQKNYETNFDHEHDAGLYFRVGAGVSYVVSNATDGENRRESEGLAVTPELSIGFIATENLAVGGSIWAIVSPEIGRVAVGPSVSYYPLPSIYGSAAIGPIFGNDQGSFDQWGLSSELSLGWMGWTGTETQLGGAAFLAGETFDLDGDGTTLGGWRAGVRLTFSYN